MTSYLFEWLLSESQEITSIDEVVAKRQPWYTVGKKQHQEEIGEATIENSMQVPQKVIDYHMIQLSHFWVFIQRV